MPDDVVLTAALREGLARSIQSNLVARFGVSADELHIESIRALSGHARRVAVTARARYGLSQPLTLAGTCVLSYDDQEVLGCSLASVLRSGLPVTSAAALLSGAGPAA